MKKVFFVICMTVSGFVAMLFASTSAWAEYNYFMSSSFLHNQNTYPKINFSHYKYDDENQEESSPRKTKIKPKPETRSTTSKFVGRASANNNPLPYSRDRALSAKLRDEFLEDFAKQRTSTSVDHMRATTEKNDLVQVVAGTAQLNGLDSGTMEGLMALWYGQAWAVANQKPLPTSQQYQGIAEQLRRTVAQSSEWNTMSNEKRQTLFEQLAYPLFVQQANYQAYLKEGKVEAIKNMASATQEGLKKIGLNLQNLQLSDKGFVRL